jgi:hypothetical protein
MRSEPACWNVSLQGADIQDLKLKIESSAGSRSVTSIEVAEGYESEARLPAEPWRRLSDSDFRILHRSQKPEILGSSVAIVRLPAGVTSKLRSKLGTRLPTSIQNAVTDLTEAMVHSGSEPIWLGANSAPHGRVTITQDTRIQRYIGLHVDSWDDESLDKRAQSRNRICFNLGSERRYFLFVPYSLQTIANFVRASGGEVLPNAPTTLGRLFLKIFPQIPILRCELMPGEGYIAPTENILHDASTVGTKSLDRSLTIRGHFTLR